MTADYEDLLVAARRVARQLDMRGNQQLKGLPETLCRALKVQEEAGELAQAVIGVLGQNPRKGITHSWHHVIYEAIDVALSALVLADTAVENYLDPREPRLSEVLDDYLAYLRDRASSSGAPDVTSSEVTR